MGQVSRTKCAGYNASSGSTASPAVWASRFTSTIPKEHEPRSHLTQSNSIGLVCPSEIQPYQLVCHAASVFFHQKKSGSDTCSTDADSGRKPEKSSLSSWSHPTGLTFSRRKTTSL